MFTGSKKLLAVAAFTIALIALVNLAWWVYYDRTARMMDQQLGRRLTAIAGTAAVSIETETVTNLLLDDLNAFVEITQKLEAIRQADSLAELFVVDHNYRLWATTSFDDDSLYFLADLNGRYIDSIFFAAQPRALATESYKPGDIYLKSGFAPLVDSSGFVVAVLGVEANVDYFDALTDLKSNLWYSTLLSLGAGLIIGIIFLLFQRRVNRAEQHLFLNETHSYLGRMVAVVSQEIKNPLMIIRASAERLLKKSPGEESRFIVEEVDRLDGIVTGYLDFAGARGNLVQTDNLQPTDMAAMVTNIRQHFQSKYPGHQIEWLGDNSLPKLTINTRPRSVRQVILNLLINGADACLDAGKPIAVGLAVTDSSESVTIAVIDHGPGIARRELKKIFTPFYTTKQAGSGLGLYLSKKIIADMGGTMDIESKIGHYTRIVLKLPKTPKV